MNGGWGSASSADTGPLAGLASSRTCCLLRSSHTRTE